MFRNIVLVIVLALGVVGCRGLTPSAESALRDGIAANKGHMADDGLPAEAREIATDDHDLYWAVLYHQGVVDELPEDVQDRKDARGGGQ